MTISASARVYALSVETIYLDSLFALNAIIDYFLLLCSAKAAGAVVVFAHPTVYKSMPLLRELVAEGAIDGIEVHHPRNSPEDRAECAELCKKHDLIVTGGSDFHGANHGKPHPVGACVTEDDQIARIEALARKRRGGAL